MKLQPVCLLLLSIGCAISLGIPAHAQDAVGVITEIKLNRGDVEIRLPGKSWQKPAPLQSLYAGTHIQASRDAVAVVLYTEGMKTVTIDAKNSPFESSPPRRRGARALRKSPAPSWERKSRPTTRRSPCAAASGRRCCFRRGAPS
ncbi:MAG TPA: hypothetical protein VGA73_05115 [Candidatus Binatia bacterium]